MNENWQLFVIGSLIGIIMAVIGYLMQRIVASLDCLTAKVGELAVLLEGEKHLNGEQNRRLDDHSQRIEKIENRCYERHK